MDIFDFFFLQGTLSSCELALLIFGTLWSVVLACLGLCNATLRPLIITTSLSPRNFFGWWRFGPCTLVSVFPSLCDHFDAYKPSFGFSSLVIKCCRHYSFPSWEIFCFLAGLCQPLSIVSPCYSDLLGVVSHLLGSCVVGFGLGNFIISLLSQVRPWHIQQVGCSSFHKFICVFVPCIVGFGLGTSSPSPPLVSASSK